jgi:hypothetical protein
LLVVVLLLLVGGLAALGYGGMRLYRTMLPAPSTGLPPAPAGDPLEVALTEADRLDPKWRWEELHAGRAAIPEAENSAAVVLRLARSVPDPWPLREPGWPPAWLPEQPNGRLRDEQIQVYAEQLARVPDLEVCLAALRARPNGRYAVPWRLDWAGIHKPLNHLLELRLALRVVECHAIYRGALLDPDGALRSGEAALNVGRSVGDEPRTLSQWVRGSCQQGAVEQMERALGQGAPAAASLAQAQARLAEEAQVPLVLYDARGERALMHATYSAVARNEVDRAALEKHRPEQGTLAAGLLGLLKDEAARAPGPLQREHARALRFTTEMAETAKLPMPPPRARVIALQEEMLKTPEVARNLLPRAHDRFLLFQRYKALLNCAAVALAVERYRQANGRWPGTLPDLVPLYLNEVPTDPFDGRPLRYRHVGGNVVVYSVGRDGVDDGGDFRTLNTFRANTDVGF